MKAWFLAGMMLLSSLAIAQSGEEQARWQARSIHLNHALPESGAKVVYLELTPEEVYPGTYACMLGFDGGYAGVQELTNGQHVAIFSVWEPGDPFDFAAHPDAVEESKQTKNLYRGEGVFIERFGGEGTGGKSMMVSPWKVGEPVIMAISCAADGKYRTAYTCWVWQEAQKAWFRMATFSTLVGGHQATLRSPYSFLEDFFRNGESKHHVRRARLSPLWWWDGATWQTSPAAFFSGDNNILTSVDAGPSPVGYWFATGGDTQNVTSPLFGWIRPGGDSASPEGTARREALLKALGQLRN